MKHFNLTEQVRYSAYLSHMHKKDLLQLLQEKESWARSNGEMAESAREDLNFSGKTYLAKPEEYEHEEEIAKEEILLIKEMIKDKE